MMKYIVKFIAAIVLLSVLLIGYTRLEAGWLKVTAIDVTSGDIPPEFNNTKIVFASDIHHGPHFSVNRVQQLVAKINSQNPDIIILGGDYIDGGKKYIEPVFTVLKSLKAKHGVYAVTGNHDHWQDITLTRQLLLKSNFKLCDNRSYWVKKGKSKIKIGGVGDLWEDTQLLNKTIAGLKKADFSILLSHNPDYMEQMKTDLIDLTLAGHTHGGQVTLFGLWAPVLPSAYGNKYRYGLKKIGSMQAYITSGVGTISPPVRFFCRPEIVVITLKRTGSL